MSGGSSKAFREVLFSGLCCVLFVAWYVGGGGGSSKAFREVLFAAGLCLLLSLIHI